MFDFDLQMRIVRDSITTMIHPSYAFKNYTRVIGEYPEAVFRGIELGPEFIKEDDSGIYTILKWKHNLGDSAIYNVKLQVRQLENGATMSCNIAGRIRQVTFPEWEAIVTLLDDKYDVISEDNVLLQDRYVDSNYSDLNDFAYAIVACINSLLYNHEKYSD